MVWKYYKSLIFQIKTRILVTGNVKNLCDDSVGK